MRHTKGEWEVVPSDCMTAHYVLVNAYNYFEEGYESDDPQTAIALRQEDEANACLMEAAPDLLAACEYFMESAEWNKKEFAYTVSDFCHSQIKKAIAKAKP